MHPESNSINENLRKIEKSAEKSRIFTKFSSKKVKMLNRNQAQKSIIGEQDTIIDKYLFFSTLLNSGNQKRQLLSGTLTRVTIRA